MSREELLVRTFVELADTLVDDFDVVELLTRLAGPDGELRIVGSSSDAIRVLELFELQAEEGPCPDCYRTGEPIASPRITAIDARWPRFAPRALEAGFRSVHALPMRLHRQTIGALNLFRTGEGSLDKADVAAAQAFADVATIGILQRRAAGEAKAVNEQLTHALNSRIVVEQAKGMVAERTGLEMEQSFNRLRNHARNHNLRLVDVARDIIDGTLAVACLDAPT